MSDEQVRNEIKGRRIQPPTVKHGLSPDASHGGYYWVTSSVDGPLEHWFNGPFDSEELAVLDYKAWLGRMNADPMEPSWESEAVDKSGKLNARVIVRDCVAACRDLERAPIVDIVQAVIGSAGDTLKDIEKEIEDAGGSTPNVCAVLMGVGAVFEIARQLPGTRGQLVEAGRVVGRAMSARYEAQIKAKIAEQQGGN